MFKAMTCVGLFTVTVSLANAQQCLNIFQEEMAVLSPEPSIVKTIVTEGNKIFDKYHKFNYSNFFKILFLSDGGKAGNAFKDYYFVGPSKQLVISSDFVYQQGVTIRIDNNRLPFQENSFDLIFMNRGLCTCRNTITCGGIDTNRDSMKSFLKSTINILDKNNPNSLLVMTGFYYNTLLRTVPPLWISVFKELQIEYPYLQFAILRGENKNKELPFDFVGLGISVDPTTPIEVRLQKLYSSVNTDHDAF